jgi:hypothetical protein
METTLGATALAVAVQSGAVALPWMTWGEVEPLLCVVVDEVDEVDEVGD